MDADDRPIAIPRQRVARARLRVRAAAAPGRMDDSTFILLALVGGALIGYLAALV